MFFGKKIPFKYGTIGISNNLSSLKCKCQSYLYKTKRYLISSEPNTIEFSEGR